MNLNDVQILLDVLPEDISEIIPDPDNLIEIILDLGRPLELRYNDNSIVVIEDKLVHTADINYITSLLSTFGQDNRAGIDGTLHRISRIQNRHEKCVGLTCRIGKPFFGSVSLIKDLVEQGHNILILGAPGMGKTTVLRDTARYLSLEAKKRTVIVDTSNEIAGDGDIAHPAVGRARRLQVPYDKTQHLVMIEAVENHMPETIIIDEISTIQEAQAAKTIAQRGVQLIATAHGKKLEDVLNNPPLVDLIGGINVVTLSDDLAKLRGTSKTVQERKTDPTFNVIVEILNFNEINVHFNTATAVDTILAGGTCVPEHRQVVNGEMKIISKGRVSIPLSRVELAEISTRQAANQTPTRRRVSRRR